MFVRDLRPENGAAGHGISGAELLFNLRELNSNTIFFASPAGISVVTPDRMQKFIVGAPQEWLNLCAELLRVGAASCASNAWRFCQTSTRVK